MSESSSTSEAARSHAALARHSLWNVLGMTLPMVVGLFAIPLLIRGLGEDRFGALTLVWMLVGYFSIFDLGMGRALTKLAAERLGGGREGEVPALFWTALLVTLGVGSLAGAAVVLAAEPLATRWLDVEPTFQPEVAAAFRVAGWGLPAVVITVGMIGVLEAYQRFFLVNLFRLPFGTFTFLGPLIALPFSRELPVLVAVLIGGRLLEGLVYFGCCLGVAPVLRGTPVFSRSCAALLLGFGGWMTLSNLLLPLMINLVDRYSVGALLGMSVVAFYTTPSELVVKMLILPRAWVSALFPRFSAGHAVNPVEAGRLCVRGLRMLWVLMFPAALAVMAIAPEFLRLWLGPEKGPVYAANAGPVMQLLAWGMYLYAPAYVPFSYLQAIGRPDRPAKLHLLEFPLLVALMWVCVPRFGLAGAAYAWSARALLDLLLLLGVSRSQFPSGAGLWSFLVLYLAGAVALFPLTCLAHWKSRLMAAVFLGLLWAGGALAVALTPGERRSLLRPFHPKPG